MTITGDISRRLRALLSDVSRSDGGARPTPYSVANTSMSHTAIGLWSTLGGMAAGLSPLGAVALAVAAWGGWWEARQYMADRTTRTRRDWLLGDLPSYALGAVSAAWLIGAGINGAWIAWLALTPAVVAMPVIQAAIFGRVTPNPPE
jgi:hypothetical protein